MLCSRCRKNLPADAFHRDRTRKQFYCKVCKTEDRRERRRRARVGAVFEIIDETDRCLWHCVCPDYCRRRATWRNGEWRACDTHKLPGDVPISVSDRSATRHEREAAAWPIVGRVVVDAG